MSPLADITFETVDGVLVARVEGEVDMSNASELGAAITGRIPSDARGLVLDLGAVDTSIAPGSTSSSSCRAPHAPRAASGSP